MEILASYDLTRTAWSAAQLVGCDPKTVQRYVDLRDAGLDPFRRTRRARLIDPTWRRWRSWWRTRAARSVPTWSTTGCGRWGSPATSGRRGGRWRWPRRPTVPVAGARTGPGCRSRGSGCYVEIHIATTMGSARLCGLGASAEFVTAS